MLNERARQIVSPRYRRQFFPLLINLFLAIREKGKRMRKKRFMHVHLGEEKQI